MQGITLRQRHKMKNWWWQLLNKETMGLLATVAILGLWCCVSVQGSFINGKIIVLQDPNDENKKMLVIVSRTIEEDSDDDAYQCEFFTHMQFIEELLKVYGEDEIHSPTKNELKEIKEECTRFSFRRRRRGASQEKESSPESSNTTTPSSQHESTGWTLIFPGTKWCGAGDIAENDDDLGYYKDSDRCCRAHDKCDDFILAGETKYNLTNKSPFTQLSCKCDNKFYDCLNQVNSGTSNTIGSTYFNILQNPCYQKDYPQTNKCEKYRTILKLSCLQYARDTTAPKVYQWNPAKKYRKLPFGISTATIVKEVNGTTNATSESNELQEKI